MRDKVLPARVVGGSSGTKFSLLASNAPKSAFFGVLGEFCTGWAAGLGVLGEFCTGWAAGLGVLGEFCLGRGLVCGTKFSLLGLLVARAVQSSPCWRQMPQNRRFSVCWESFVPGGPLAWVCWESFVPVRPARAANRESFVPGRRIRCAGPVSRNHRNHCGLPVCCRQASDVVT